MNIEAIKTRSIKIGDNIIAVIDDYLPKINENAIIAITAKIVSICQKRVIPAESVENKNTLIKQEADAILAVEANSNINLTIKDNRVIPFAGIDESNGNGCYVLHPENIQYIAQKIWQHLRAKHNISNLGILITDSNITMLRRGVTGIAVGWCGFLATYDYRNKQDIFGRKLKLTYVNNIDALAAMAVFAMGEGDESTPIAVIQNPPRIDFTSMPPSKEELQEIKIPIEEDFYRPIINAVEWIKKEDL